MTQNVTVAPIASIEQLTDFQDEWVYDIGIHGTTPYFFGNDILVHNSCYFSVYNAWNGDTQRQSCSAVDLETLWSDYEKSSDAKAFVDTLDPVSLKALELMLTVEHLQDVGTEDDLTDVLSELDAFISAHSSTSTEMPSIGGKYGHLAGTFEWTKDNVIKLYDDIATDVNTTFAGFMDETFHTGLERGSIIAAGREIVAENAMYIKKKRYAALVIDDGGKRFDKDGKPGKLKAMGLETKRSDTPAFIQDFLEDVLMKVLQGVPEEDILTFIIDFRRKFETYPGWQKGRPTAIKGLTKYSNALDGAIFDDFDIDDDDEMEVVDGKVTMPGHVRAAINFNNMLGIMHDLVTPPIRDGDKVVVCQLRNNPYNITSIARPVDVPEQNLPQWLKDLPFDHDKMETSMIDVKIENLIGILRWDLKRISDKTTFTDLFEVAKTASGLIEKAIPKGKPKKEKVSLDGDLFVF